MRTFFCMIIILFIWGCSFSIDITMKMDKHLLDKLNNSQLILSTKQGPYSYGLLSQYIKRDNTIKVKVANSVPRIIIIKTNDKTYEIIFNSQQKIYIYNGVELPTIIDRRKKAIIVDFQSIKE